MGVVLAVVAVAVMAAGLWLIVKAVRGVQPDYVPPRQPEPAPVPVLERGVAGVLPSGEPVPRLLAARLAYGRDATVVVGELGAGTVSE